MPGLFCILPEKPTQTHKPTASMKPIIITLLALTLTACSFTRETSKKTETETETKTDRIRTTFSDLSEFITITLPELPPAQPIRDGNDTDVATKPTATKPKTTKPEPAPPPVFAGLPAGTRIEIRREKTTTETEQEQTETREETREESEEKVYRQWFSGFSLFWVGLTLAVLSFMLLVMLSLLRRF